MCFVPAHGEAPLGGVNHETTHHALRTLFTELHSHSAFSFLDGASLPEQLVLEAARLGYPALALTDHNGLYGSMAFAHAAKQHGLQAITGAEVTLLDGSHVTLLAEIPAGYANLCRLLTEAHLGRSDRRDPRLDFASLEARHEGLIVLSGCRSGLLPAVLKRDGRPAARRLAERCRAVFGSERFFVELQRNACWGTARSPWRWRTWRTARGSASFTSVMRARSTVEFRSRSDRISCAARSSGRTSARLPPKEPMGVRMPSSMNARV